MAIETPTDENEGESARQGSAFSNTTFYEKDGFGPDAGAEPHLVLPPPQSETDPGVAQKEPPETFVTRGGDDSDPFAPPPPLPFVRFMLLGITLCLGLFLSMIDASIVATSLYSIAADFQSLDNINWVALAYTLTYLGCAILFSRVSDVIGRRDAFLAAFVIFVAFSLGCGWARDLNMLIAFRALQGIGGSGLYSLTMIILPEIASDGNKQMISGMIGAVIAIAGVLGPVLGGILTHYSTWRWVFWINGPVGGAAAVLFYFAWPPKKYLPTTPRRRWSEIDYVGSFLLLAGAILVTFSFQNAGANSNQWKEAIFLVPLILGVFCLLTLFAWQVFVERRWGDRVAAAFPLVLLRNRAFASGVGNIMFMGFPYLLCIYVFPLRFQVVNGKSALEAGLMLLPMLGAAAIGSVLGGAINGVRNRIFETLMAACCLMLLGCALETMITPSPEFEAKTLGFLAFIGLGFGLSASAATMLANLESPEREHAPAQGIMAQMRIFGGTVGIAASSAILSVKTSSELAGILTPEQLQLLADTASQLTATQMAAVRRAYTDAFRQDMIVCCAVLTVGLVVTAGTFRRNRFPVLEQLRIRREEERARQARAREGASPLAESAGSV